MKFGVSDEKSMLTCRERETSEFIREEKIYMCKNNITYTGFVLFWTEALSVGSTKKTMATWSLID